MKTCCRCKKEMLETCFHKSRKTKDGYRYECKDCKSKENKLYMKEYNVKDDVRKKKREYMRKNYERDYAKQKIRYQEDPLYRLKSNARNRLHYEITTGRIKKQDCETCGCVDTQAHHPDYLHPLKINWLCKKCHEDWHIKNGDRV